MSRIQVNSIVNKTDTAGPELTFGATVPSTSVFNVQSGVNITGVITASNFVGNGSALTGLSIATKSKAIAFKIIFGAENNFRS
jgi:hypothetical protein